MDRESEGGETMRSTKWLWRATGLFGLLSTIVLAAGMVYGINTILNPKGETLPDETASPPTAAPSPAGGTDASKIQILALGDSLTKGYGDDKGEGYVGRVKRGLETSTGKPVYLWNFAVNGATTADMAAEINKPTSADYIRQADIILFTIGGNDLNRIANAQPASPAPSPSAEAAEGASPAPAGSTAATPAAGANPGAVPQEIQFNMDELKNKLPASEERLASMLDKLAQLNPKARILYVGLYHPFLEYDPNRVGAEWIGRWNNTAFQAANRHPNVTVVPTYDIFQLHGTELLFSDHFHPNTAGYDEIAARVMQVLK